MACPLHADARGILHRVGSPAAWCTLPCKTYRLAVLHTNDHHGHFWKNGDGEYGLAARKMLIDQIRAEVKAAGGHAAARWREREHRCARVRPAGRGG